MSKKKTDDPAVIDPGLRSLVRPIGSIKLWHMNPRQGDVGAISESLKRFGQKKPVVVQRATMRIIAGNHLWRAAKALGWQSIAANVSDVPDEEAAAYALADNRIADLGTYDEDALLKVLTAVGATDELLAGTGYDLDDLQALVQKLDDSPRAEQDGGQQTLESKWAIIVNCASEQQQTELLERFQQEGIACRALVG